MDSGDAQTVPTLKETLSEADAAVKIANAGESDVVEQVLADRLAYRQSLELLIKYYTKEGNNTKLIWAEKELAALNKTSKSQYNYIIEATVAGPDLKASDSISEADYMYANALHLENKAKGLIVITDENLLRKDLSEYNKLIRKHPTSDKIDDAAFRAAGIYEYFKDYSLAVLYYQRVFQWDTATKHPAVFKAAYILDTYMHNRAEALIFYQRAVTDENLSSNYKEYAETRIKELTKSEESSQESK
jgi:tetratricopeptide (TPR) repeat protein